MSDRRCCDCKHEQLYVTGKHCDACYHVEGHPNFDPNEKGRLRSRVAELEARVVELERENARLNEGAQAAVWANKFVRDGEDAQKARVVELEREKADECAASKARLAALEWLRDKQLLRIIMLNGVWQATTEAGRDFAGQPAEDFYSCLSASIGAQCGPREEDQQ